MDNAVCIHYYCVFFLNKHRHTYAVYKSGKKIHTITNTKNRTITAFAVIKVILQQSLNKGVPEKKVNRPRRETVIKGITGKEYIRRICTGHPDGQSYNIKL